MRKKNKVLPILENVEILDAGAEGKAVARVDGMVVFVPYVVPGDVVDIQLTKKRKSYAEGKAVSIKQFSPLRVEAKCPHFGMCGGCKWQTTHYDEQLKFKQKQVEDNLTRLGQVNTAGMRKICGSEEIFFYRNKLEYSFSNKQWVSDFSQISSNEPQWGALGFHVPMLFDKVINIEHCVLQREPSNAIRLALRDYAREKNLPCYDARNHTGYLRNIMLRCSTTGEWMMVVVVAEDREEWLNPMMEHLHTRFPEITSLQYVINTKFNDTLEGLTPVVYYGKDHIEEQMQPYHGGLPLKFKINPKSFYQTNSRQAQRLYSFVAEFAELGGNETVYDLYTGTGTIALFLASMCQRVIGIEYVEEAIADAKVNAKINGFDNTTFFAGDMAKVLTADFVDKNGHPDVVITDPPRAGMHEKVVEQLLNMEARKIIYVSCNPATQARDLQMLSVKYEVKRIQPVDMFPHTQHVENVAELVLRN